MNELEIYDPWDAHCKTPFGAVPAGTTVQFHVRPLRRDGVLRVTLVGKWEQRRDQRLELPLVWTGLDGARDLFSCALEITDYVGLLWYHFVLELGHGRLIPLSDHQLTVYDGSETVPDWFGGGLTYQIFPDRFHRTVLPDPAGLVGGRTVHQGWQEEPDYLPDAHGEIRNRDFFGGNLAGILEKLPYLHSLGVETLYLCPIFEGAENHRYGIGDYEKIDPMLGNEEDFSALCSAAHALGMRVLLDGVFNHTGYVSRYFNGDGSYPELGAHQSQASPYFSWFSFRRWPEEYDAWWGIYSLPNTNERDPGFRAYMLEGEHCIVRRWLRAGADGWRLDVADELPDDFIRDLHAAARAEKPDAVILGEVWEDGSNKVAYSERRRHIWGRHCDGLMNYPFRTALIDFLLGGDAHRFLERMETLREHYPPFAWYGGMNFLGTHDTVRILTLLGTGDAHTQESRQWRAEYRLSPAVRTLGIRRLRLASLVLYAFPGSPTLYYGDEAGMEGFEDPFNRRTFPWEQEDTELLLWFQTLGRARRALLPLRRGELRYRKAEKCVLAFSRVWGKQEVFTAVNAGTRTETVTLPWSGASLRLPPLSGRLIPNPACGDAFEGL